MNKHFLEHVGIVIRIQPLGELDRFVTLYTANLGKVTCVAKGIRTIQSKRAGHIEILNRVKIQLWKNRNYHYLRECRSDEKFEEIKMEMSSLSSALFMVEALERLTLEEHSHEELFKLFNDSLELMKFYPSQHELIREIFILKMLHFLGHMSSFRNCGQCHRLLPFSDGYILQRPFLVSCEACLLKNPNRHGGSFEKMPLETLKLMNFILGHSPQSVLAIQIEAWHQKILTQFGRIFLEKNLSYPLRSEKALALYN